MKRAIIFGVLVIVAVVSYLFERKAEKGQLKVGIVVPMQHAALDDIVAGFQSELTAALGNTPVKIEIQNAMGDINLQRSAISKFLNEKVDLLVPVGKAATQMAIQLAPKERSVLFLAAKIPLDSPDANQKAGLMGVIDEISIPMQTKFIHQVLPDLKKVTVIYSSSEKVFDDVDEFLKAATPQGLSVQKLMVQNLSELYTVSQRIESDSHGIFILKDHLVASGINALVQQADKLKIPLMTSDEGTIKSGGAFALGVVEADIGRQGGRMAAEFLKNKKIEKALIQHVDKISVFVNKPACDRQGVPFSLVFNAATSLGLNVIGG